MQFPDKISGSGIALVHRRQRHGNHRIMGGANCSRHQYRASPFRLRQSPGQRPASQSGRAGVPGTSDKCALVDDRQQSPAARKSRRPGAIHKNPQPILRRRLESGDRNQENSDVHSHQNPHRLVRHDARQRRPDHPGNHGQKGEAIELPTAIVITLIKT